MDVFDSDVEEISDSAADQACESATDVAFEQRHAAAAAADQAPESAADATSEPFAQEAPLCEAYAVDEGVPLLMLRGGMICLLQLLLSLPASLLLLLPLP